MSNRKPSNGEEHRTQPRATLQAVADRAGVSVTTASVVLTGKQLGRRISESASDRVRQAADDLNYAPNLLVRSLKRGRTHILSFYNGFRRREQSDAYMDKLAAAVEYAGGAFGYDILIRCNYQRSAQETYEFLNGGFADGVLMFAPDSNDPLVELLRRSALPVVLMNSRDHAGILPSIADDNDSGLAALADALASLGHRRVAAIGASGVDVRDADVRLSNLCKHMRRHEFDELSVYSEKPGHQIVETVKEIMASPKPPTALFCWHDRLAYRVIDACEELGISVPGTMSVIGYDGLHWPSRAGHTAASIKVDLEALADKAVRIADRYVHGYRGPLIEEVLPVSFTPGTTLAPVPEVRGDK